MLAGCTGDGASDESPASTPTGERSRSETPTAEGTPTPEGTPTAGESPCPAAAAVTFEAEASALIVDRNDDAVESIEFLLRNGGECALDVVPEAWRIERLADGAWEQVATGSGDASGPEAVSLAPGDGHRWSLSLSPHPTPHTDEKTFVVPDGEFPAGTYRFAPLVAPDAGGTIAPRARFDVRYTGSAG